MAVRLSLVIRLMKRNHCDLVLVIPIRNIESRIPTRVKMKLRRFEDRKWHNFGAFLLNGSWRESTLNRGILADRGHANNFSIELTVPGSEIEYFRATYDAQYFVPVGPLTFRFRNEFGYGDGLGDTEKLPFFEHFLAGGFGSVRGFESNTLGPRT